MRRLGEVSSESALYPEQCQGAMWVKAILMILSQHRQRDKLPWGGKIFFTIALLKVETIRGPLSPCRRFLKAFPRTPSFPLLLSSKVAERFCPMKYS